MLTGARDAHCTPSAWRTQHSPDDRGGTAERSAPPVPKHPLVALLLPLRLIPAAGWLKAGVEEVIEPEWWTGP